MGSKKAIQDLQKRVEVIEQILKQPLLKTKERKQIRIVERLQPPYVSLKDLLELDTSITEIMEDGYGNISSVSIMDYNIYDHKWVDELIKQLKDKGYIAGNVTISNYPSIRNLGFIKEKRRGRYNNIEMTFKTPRHTFTINRVTGYDIKIMVEDVRSNNIDTLIRAISSQTLDK